MEQNDHDCLMRVEQDIEKAASILLAIHRKEVSASMSGIDSYFHVLEDAKERLNQFLEDDNAET